MKYVLCFGEAPVMDSTETGANSKDLGVHRV